MQTICERNRVFHTITIVLIEYYDRRCQKPVVTQKLQSVENEIRIDNNKEYSSFHQDSGITGHTLPVQIF